MRHPLYLVSLTNENRTWQSLVGAKDQKEVRKKLREYHAFKFKINWIKDQGDVVIV
jgi:hypothetical protein